MRSDRTILITGGTGQQGAAAAAALARRGWTVRVLTRDASSAKARALTTAGVQLAEASLDDRHGLQSAMADAHAVFCVMPLVTSAMPAGSFERQLTEAKNAVDASVAAGVEDFVLSSASSAERNVNPNLHNKFLVEQYIRSTGRRATFIRPVAFMDNFVLPQWGLHQGVFTSALLPTTRQPLISVRDIGEFVAIMLERPYPDETTVRSIEIAGDELLPAEMAAALSAALGRPIPYLQVSTDVLLAINPNSGKGYARINAGAMNVVDIAAARALHPGLMDFRAWLANIGADRLRALLPQPRPGEVLSALPAWRLEGIHTNHERTTHADLPML
jgi:uncharacterized protein YbjT (DUF2867 family)